MHTKTSSFAPAPSSRITASLGVLLGAYLFLAVLALLFQVGPFVPLGALLGGLLLVWSAASLRFGLTATVVAACLVPVGLAVPVGPLSVNLGRFVSFAFVTGWLAALSRRDGPLPRRTPIDAAIALMAFAFLLSMTVNMPQFRGPEFGEAFEESARFGVEFLFFFLAATSVLGAGRRHLDRALRTVSLVVAAIAALGIVDWVTNQNVFAFVAPVLPGNVAETVRAVSEQVVHERGGVRRAVGTFQGPNHLGSAIVLVLPLLVHYASVPGRRRRLYLASAGVATLAGILTISRSVFVCLALVLFVYLIGVRSIRIGWSGIAAVLLVVIAALVASPQIRDTIAVYFEGIVGQQQESSVQSRVKDYDNVLRQFDRAPLAGSGPATWSEKALSRPDNDKVDPTGKGERVLDNEFLSALAERGAIGLLTLLALLLGAIAIAVRAVAVAPPGEERSLRAALLASLVAFFALCAFFNVFAFYASAKLYFLLVAATMVVSGHTRAVQRPVQAQPTGDPVIMSIETSRSTTVGALGSGPETENVERADIGHFFAVVARWWVVVLAGTIFVVGTAVALLRLTTPPYRAQVVMLFDQPVSGGLNGQQGLAATENVISLLPTYASVARSDQVLRDSAAAAGVTATIEELRDRVDVQVVPSTLAIRMAVEDANAQIAERLTAALTETFAKHLDEEQASAGVQAEQRSTVIPISIERATRASRSEARTIALAAILGLTIMVGVAFLLEYIRPRPRDG